MEFPEDVLTVIRAYSKPCMQFYREYNTIMRELGLQEWREVQLKLCTDQAEAVIQALIVYKDAYLASEKFQILSNHNTYSDVFVLYYREYKRLETIRDTAERALRILLVGEEKVVSYERWARYELDLDEFDEFYDFDE